VLLVVEQAEELLTRTLRPPASVSPAAAGSHRRAGARSGHVALIGMSVHRAHVGWCAI
jgi:hypothetical protein